MTHFLTRPEGRIAYTDDGTGPLVVLVPGMGDLRTTWRELTVPLLSDGYRVVTMDLRGHGDSDATFTEHGQQATADDVQAMLDHLGAGPQRPAVLVGASFAAGSVSRVAALAPEQVAGLVLVAFAANDVPAPAAARQVRLLLRRPWGPAAWAWFSRRLNRGRRAPWLGEHLAAVRADLRRPGHLESLLDLALALLAGTGDPLTDQVHVPTLVLVGASDPESPDPAAHLAQTLARLPHAPARGLLVPEAGHFPQSQRPDLVLGEVRALLAELPSHQDAAARA